MMKPYNKVLLNRLFLLSLLGCLVGGCEAEQPIVEKIAPRTELVSGLLEHFPENVQSTQAWYGHYYMVGDTPVIPTKEVPAEILQSFIGSEVVIQGVWHPGEKWNPPTEEQNSLPRPTDLEQHGAVRGDGVKVSSIAPVKE
ncbi:MAG: hypothetical protein HOA14_01105 [Planctomycetaceae bacterium]|jgi:hypothetical protein|nr:hypothetical protein [Planctomycetaceae bacterium]MBT4724214.1 hypothetical protein [Planctomycetaceae bacterium]MBT5126138.1 hypothetical protein [Planctomycetaceae bacterium]MBT5885655.1 hypothetical protein [Planctomycetaceae bacterium]MBT6845995.1 hypothetical protein [Planctomycetaceae bacterium]